jgi:hypothetical protein
LLCKRPFVKDGIEHGCGQCLPCRINRRRLWTHRILLESYSHDCNAFVTLTYDEDNCPRTESGSLTLDPKDTTKWLKRLRKRVSPRKVRYYLVGEYGEQTDRPHYHLALFNFPSCVHGRPQIVGNQGCLCSNCRVIQETWNLGFTYNGEVTKDSASYIAQYVTKSLTKFDDVRLQGRHPEFARMSTGAVAGSGIGAGSIDKLATAFKNSYGDHYLATHGDVPPTLSHGGTKFPLGRYLTNQLRLALGREEGCPEEKLSQLMIDRKDLIFRLFETGEYSHGKAMEILKKKQQIQNLETKTSIYKKGQKL